MVLFGAMPKSTPHTLKTAVGTGVLIENKMKNSAILLVTVLFWALNFYLGKHAIQYVSPNAAGFWRYFFGVLALFALSAATFPSWQRIRENLFGVFLVGFVGLFGFIWLFFQGLQYTSEMNGALFISLNPATTLLLAMLLQGHKATWREILGIFIAFTGAVYLLTKGNIAAILEIAFNTGDLIFMLANVIFAIQNLWIKRYSKNLGNLHFTTLTNLCCLLGFAVLLLWEGQVFITSLPIDFWGAVAGMGIFGTALAYYCWNYGINAMGAARGAVFINAMPLFSAFFAILFGAELYGFHLVSCVLIIGGLLLVQWQKKEM